VEKDTALLTVVYPATDIRGQIGKHLRTWTDGQTLERERYRVVVVLDGVDAAQEAAARALIRPGDEVVLVPGGNDVAMWNAGAARAGTPWLVFTEGHSLAAPGCLEAVARWIEEDPVCEAGNFEIDHPDGYRLARLSRRWFDELQTRWQAPEEWPRLHRAGFAIRSATFAAFRGFESYGQFAPPLLSARLHARGARVEPVSGARIVHLDDHRMRRHHADTIDYVRGECEARSDEDPVFFESYFGHAPVCTNRLGARPCIALQMCQAVLAAALAHPGRGITLASALSRLAARAALGAGPALALHRLAVAVDELSVDRLPLPDRLRWARFLAAHRRVIYLTQLEWARDLPTPATPKPIAGRWPIERLGPEQLVGVHGLEERDGRPLRWTEPVSLMRLAPDSGDQQLRIETGGLRGDPLGALIAVVCGRHVLPSELLKSDEEGALSVRLPARWARAAQDGLALVCSPMVPRRTGSPDTRRLGLPILSVTCTSQR
jgi:hypothetical protein